MRRWLARRLRLLAGWLDPTWSQLDLRRRPVDDQIVAILRRAVAMRSGDH